MTDLRIVRGRFHPDLEDALFAEIRRRHVDPLAPLAVAVPSAHLARRLRDRAGREFPDGLFGVDFLPLSALARRCDPGPRRSIEEPLFHARAVHASLDVVSAELREYVRSSLPVAEALRTTLRDLRDAAVPPDLLDAAIAETDPSVFTDRDRARLHDLAALHREYDRRLDRAAVTDRAGAFRRAATAPPRTPVIVYGFYDMTQVQWDFVEAVARAAPCSILAPIPHAHPAYSFAEPFLKTFLTGIAARLNVSVETLPTGSARASAGMEDLLFTEDDGACAPRMRLFSAAGARDEVWTVARDILRLVVDDERASFADIGVVARSLEPYGDAIRDLFAEHGVPIRHAPAASAASHPHVKAILRLTRLAEFDRRDVMDLILSPWFLGPKDPQWEKLTRDRNISRGLRLWRERLGDTPDLLRIVEDLASSLDLPGRASWTDMAAAYGRFIDRWIEPREAGLNLFADFDRLGGKVTRAEFQEYFERRLESLTVDSADAPGGVTVLDAAAARGLSFRVLYVLGLNDQVFPRVVAPEPFLSDAARRSIADTLGHKIDRRPRLPEKIEGHDEERLLFAMLLNAAENELVLLYQRADERGRVRAPSLFWDLVVERTGTEPVKTARNPLKRVLAGDATRLEAAAFADPPGLPPVTTVSAVWKKVAPLSATGLEMFIECPFKFFAARGLKLKDYDDPAEADGPEARELGNLYDEILTDHYSSGRPLRESAERVFAAQEREGRVLAPALWEVTKRRIVGTLEAFQALEKEVLGDARPVACQQEFTGEIAGVPMLGRADRVDRAGDDVRIIDYKGGSARRYKGNLETNARRLLLVQPGVYAALGGAKEMAFVFLDAFARFEYSERFAKLFVNRLEADDAFRAGFDASVRRAADLMRAGRFVILPDDHYCGYCKFSEICRKNDAEVRRRDESDPATAALMEIRKS